MFGMVAIALIALGMVLYYFFVLKDSKKEDK
jgi:hypothetical protein